MALLPVDKHDPSWVRVREYIDARKAEVMDELRSLTVTDQERYAAAVRLDELDILAGAPDETRRQSQNRRDPNEAPRIY